VEESADGTRVLAEMVVVAVSLAQARTTARRWGLNQKLHDQEYSALFDEWTEAETARQHIVDRFRTVNGPPSLDDPIWEEWDRADEKAGHAREAVRSFLAADRHAALI
jgi:hypothetical protein